MEVEESSKPERYDETAPLTGNNNNNDDSDEGEDQGVAGCGCFRWRRRWRKTTAASGSTTFQDDDQEEAKRSGRSCLIWLKAKAKKMKKNFIRSRQDNKKKNKTAMSNFQYDPRSYALNFDDGIDKEQNNNYFNFSGRHVLPIKP